MRTHLALPLFLLLGGSSVFVACSSGSDGSSASAGDDGGVASGDDDSGSSGDAGATGDAKAAQDGAGGDGSTLGDAGKKAPIANPPAGSTKCGHGTFTAGDVVTACAAPAYIIDDYMQIDGGFAPLPRACNAITTNGGAWETWCTATQTYIFVRYDQVTNTGSLTDCHGASILEIDMGAYEASNSGGNGAFVSTYQANGTQIVGTPPATPQIATYETTIGDNSTNGGAATFVLGNTMFTGCPSGPILPTVLAGAHVTWKR